MPRCRCEEHGLTWCVETCVHLTVDRVGQWPGRVEFADIVVCEACASRFGLAAFAGLSYWELFDEPHAGPFDASYSAFHSSGEYTGECTECLDDARLRHARATGLDDPFSVYERTLTWRESEEVDELRALLEREVSWQLSARDEHELAFWLRYGGLRRPLSLEAYYLTSAAERDRVTAIVREFLAQREKNQAVLRYYEAERFEVERRAQSTVITTLPAVLLAEVWLDCEPPREPDDDG